MTKVNLIVLLFVAFVCFAAPSCFLVDEYRTCPAVWEGEAARLKFKVLRKPISVTGITFLEEKLYLATTEAILEFNGERLDGLYKCRRADWDEFYVTGIDHISNRLWFYDHRGMRLVQFDGTIWSSEDVPALPEPEYYSRGDANAGFDGFVHDGKFIILNKHRFTIPKQRRAWTYEGEKNWSPFQLPDMGCRFDNPKRTVANGCLVEIGPIGNDLCAVLNGDLLGQDIAKGKPVREEFTPQTDIVACTIGGAWRVSNPQGTPDFFSDKVVYGHNAMYASTRAGKIFRITTAGPEPVASLGEVEAMTVSSEGKLLAWFSGQGIFELREDWKKLYDLPFEPGSGLRGNRLAENRGTIVITASKPYDPEVRESHPHLVWILKDGKIVQIL